MIAALKIIVPAVRETVLNAPSNHRNISEWCKKDACWTAVSRLPLDIAGEPQVRESRGSDVSEESNTPDQVNDTAVCEAIRGVAPTVWFELSAWARQTDNLRPWQRSLAYSLGMLASRGRVPSVKQGVYGRQLLLEAVASGYTHPDLPQTMLETVRTVRGD